MCTFSYVKMTSIHSYKNLFTKLQALLSFLRGKSGDVNSTERSCLLAAAVQSISCYNLFKKLDRTCNNMSEVFPLALNPLKEKGFSLYSRIGIRLRSH